MAWPFDKDGKQTPPTPEAGKETPPAPKEKSVAEIIAESLGPVNEGFTKLNERMDRFEQAIPKPKPTPTEPQALPSVWEDENAAFQTRLTPIAMRQLGIEARMVKNEVQREYEQQGFGDLWQEYKSQIDQALDGTNLIDAQGQPLRGNPDYIRNCVDMIFGREARKKGIRFDSKNKSFFLETGEGGNGNLPTPSETDGLTQEQISAAKKWGISLDEYKKAKSTLRVVQ